jgi:hypothetical protein
VILNTARGAGFGSTGSPTTDYLATGGGPGFNQSEVYNGSSWSEISALNTARYAGGGAGASSTEVIVYGGNSPSPGGRRAKQNIGMEQAGLK